MVTQIKYILRLLSPKGTGFAYVPSPTDTLRERNDEGLRFLECIINFALLLSKCSVHIVTDKKLQTSKLLRDLLKNHSGERLYLRDIVNGMGERAFAGVLLICALPEALPLPIAGVSAIIGIPLMIVSVQLLLGFRKPWLPSWVANRSLKRKDVEKVVLKILLILEKYESVIRPRWKFITTPLARRILGLILVILAFIIALPIPFGNMLPAIVTVVISLGLIEEDGVVIVLGASSACVIFAAIAFTFSAVSRFTPKLGGTNH
jgi:hypothetical protein